MKLKNKKLSTKNSIYFVSFLLTLVLIALVFLVSIPMVKKVYRMKDDLEEKKLQFEEVQKDTTRVKFYADLTEEFGTDSHLLENAVIKKEGVVDFIKRIEEVASGSGSSIEIVHQSDKGRKTAPAPVPATPATPADPAASPNTSASPPAQRVKLNLTVTGDYKSFLRFFYKLNNLPYIFNVESAKLENMKNNSILVESAVPPNYVKGEILISFPEQ